MLDNWTKNPSLQYLANGLTISINTGGASPGIYWVCTKIILILVKEAIVTIWLTIAFYLLISCD